jgi:LmbE family N-acetylglucosaminyl deacetylase
VSARATTSTVAGLLLLTGLIGGAPAAAAAPTTALTPAAPAAPDFPPPRDPADLDVLFVGAHPDDEAGRLSVYGEWAERFGTRTGVVTITRGEGGGNAVGPEEGPALGLIREAEERRAVGRAGITDVYNLDEVDFFYTVSAPLTADVWGERATLAKVVRVVRQTRPEIVVTIDPAPSPGNHGNHQQAALLALAAYQVAGDPDAFPRQLRREGLEPFAPSKIFLSSARGTGAGTGRSCPTTFTPERPTQNVYGVWGGTESEEHGTTWAAVEREAQREYASQGWAAFPDVPADPAEIGCDYLVQVDARVPYTRGNLTPAAAGPSTMLEGAVLPEPGGLPLGTGLELEPASTTVLAGGSVRVAVTVTAPRRRALPDVRLRMRAPTGWTVPGVIELGRVRPGRSVTRTVRVTVPDDAKANTRRLVSARVTSGSRRGYSDTELTVVPAVRGTQELLPRVAVFQQWAEANGFGQLEGFVKPVLTLPSGGERQVSVDVTNHGSATESGEVTLDLPAGFAADEPTRSYTGLAPGATTQVTFTVTNTDAGLPTSNAGGEAGDYDYTIETTSGAGGTTATSTTTAALELVPTTTVEEATTAPTVDGVVGADEYPGEAIDVSRLWEGAECETAADCSATAHVTRSGDDLYLAVEVTDDVLGTEVDEADCKRHWRTDSVEIAIDPDGTSENTSTTFKAFVLPSTAEGGPCAGRDADNDQGPAAETAPGMEVASELTDPYAGYVVEVKIPAEDLPSTVDPQHAGLNVLVYDSDTLDLTGQTRIGWSTWGGVQGDPYRWGVARFPGWDAPQVATQAPTIPDEALSSLDSPQTIAQAVRTGVPVAGLPAARPRDSAVLLSARRREGRVLASVRVRGHGRAHVFVVRGNGRVLAQKVVTLRPGRRVVRLPAGTGARRVLMAFDANRGGTTSSATRVR